MQAKQAAVCQGTSLTQESCAKAAAEQCVKCEQWFCEAHMHDDEWHACAFHPEAEEGGEG